MFLGNEHWNEGDPICIALNCSTSPPLKNSQLQSSCDTQYQSTCTTVCIDDYTGVGGSYTCVVTDVDTNSVGWNGSTSCQRGNTVASRSMDEEESSNIVATVAGSIVASIIFIIVVVCLVIFLLWYCIRRKRKCISATGIVMYRYRHDS